MSSFITPQLKINIGNIVRNYIIPSLNNVQFMQLLDWLCDIINTIFITFSINSNKQFEQQLMNNDAQDILGLFLLLLPHINDLDELKKITDLNQIYSMRNNVDISMNSPRYILSNIQYSRCERQPIKEIEFNMEHLYQNYVLLKYSIQTISHRMYINWKNIVPVTIDTYHSSMIYNNTLQSFINRKLRDWDIIKNETPPSHLPLCTIYETINHYLYEQIVKIKWVLFDFDIDNNTICEFSIEEDTGKTKRILPLIKILYPDTNNGNFIINTEKCMNGILWDNLTEDDTMRFDVEWNAFRQNKKYFEIIRAIAYAFSRYYGKRDTIKNYIGLRTIVDNETELRYDEQVNISKEQIIQSIDSIPTQYMYEFLRHTMHSFKSTIYYQMMYGELKTLTNDYELFDNIAIYLTPKNIYNFAKSFCHYDSDGKFTRYPKKWNMLSTWMKQDIIQRINGTIDRQQWFNIQKILRKLYYYNFEYIQYINDIIYNLCVRNLIDIVFNCLIISGTLSEFVINEQKQINRGDGYYYLNGMKYNNMIVYDEMDTYNERGEVMYKQKPYMSIVNEMSWTNMYAMDWVSQINYFHKYLNNRVILATGGTGVGKSTQLPKLLLYSLKMIDQKDTGKIICSQPRKRPTAENAMRISFEMGVGIKTGDAKNAFNNLNYNIQFQNHDEHFPLRKSELHDNTLIYDMAYPTLKIVTDKILLNSISNPLFKRKYGNNIYDTTNLYDIVIVDESHEHNQNMDMILSLIRNVLYYNNDCKLIIVSATMEEDEPIYRRFYRTINDNKMYPLNQIIAKNKLDRINVDRRLHISKPRQTTAYEITEHYLTYNTDINAEDERNEITIEIINKIIAGKNFGDMLVFRSGRTEILKCAKIINEHTPENVYVIPYYSDLPEDVRHFIEKIHNRKNEIRVSKSKNITDDITVDFFKNGNSRYDHIIVVATNVAEASITIDTLTVVIDDGIQKITTYYPEINGTIIRKQLIANSNRLQRKGRVGRTQNGTVYYLYTQDALMNVKSSYKVCTENITDTLFKLLYSDNHTEIITGETDPNIVNKFDSSNYENSIGAIIKKQYTIDGKIYKYIGNSTQYNYNNIEKPRIQYSDGYSYKDLLDDDGKFYIIHPNENSIVRNIIGDIIVKPVTDRINGHFDPLFDHMLIGGINGVDLSKTTFGIKVLNILRKTFVIDQDGLYYVIACMFASAYGCLDEVLKIITVIQNNDNCTKNSGIVNRNNMLDLFESDLFTLVDGMSNVDIEKYIQNKQLFTQFNDSNDEFNTINECLNVTELRNVDCSIGDKITLSLLHAFGHNLVKKMTGTKYYIPLKYPLKETIKTIGLSKTCVSGINLQNYILYFKMRMYDTEDIITNKIFLIHYVKPELINYIAYQFENNKIIKALCKSPQNVDYRISTEFDNARYKIVEHINTISKFNCTNKIFLGMTYGQYGGYKKYKIVKLQ